MQHRVLILTSSAELFGSERALADLTHDLIANGQRVAVVFPEFGPAVDLLERVGATVAVEPSISKVSRTKGFKAILQYGLTTLKADRRLVSFARQYGATIVYSNTSHVLSGPPLAREIGAPHVWHIREVERIPRSARHLWGRFLLRSGNVIVISRAVGLELFQPRILRRQLDRGVHVIHDGISLGNFPYLPTNRNPRDEREFLLPGRLTPWKGQLQAVRAFGQFEGFAKLRIIGGATTPRDADWVERVLLPEIREDRRVTLEAATMEMQRCYAQADFLLQTSQAIEPFGRTVIEGMASGTVPIVPDRGGPSEVVREEHEGFVYRAADTGALTGAITRAFKTDPDLLNQLRQTGRLRVERSFTSDRTSSEILNRVLNSVANYRNAK